MSTRCLIGMKNKDNTITAIYCHHDGYLKYVGALLAKYYTDPHKIELLLGLGDVSVLGTTPTSNGWDKPLDETDDEYKFYTTCETYASRGDVDVIAKTYKNKTEFVKACNESWGEYAYLFENGKWVYVSLYSDNHAWQSVTDKLAELKK